jgi:[acyl-carrier-protein] S-malonyltransferase
VNILREKIAFVFPGQGSQSVGMGKNIFENGSKAKEIFEKANNTLGYDLKKLCFEGPEEELKITYHTQPALLTTSVALFKEAENLLPKADYVAGHSLGEYSALVCAGALRFDEAVYAVRKRGEFMDIAVPSGVGAMAAILGSNRELIETSCEEASERVKSVQIANYNTPGQIVISGYKEGVEAAKDIMKEKGVKKIIDLPVSGPFHSELMKSAAEKFGDIVSKLTIIESGIPVVANVNANIILNPNEIKESLVKQIYSSVLWEESIRFMINQGVKQFVEIGSGKVLTGLIKKIERDIKTYNIYDYGSLQQVSAEIGG